ncbi:MAG: DUF3421 domain-containing protein [Deltaproteobacteria bacterium]|nr:DUF3421 domain-containing protein [Deltaproteobacteria bacterium]
MTSYSKRFGSDHLWTSSAKGTVPKGSLEGGHESDGTPLYVVRAAHGDGVHPGKVNPNSRGAFIAWGGEEVLLSSYDVLQDDGGVAWRPARHGDIPGDAFEVGQESDGTPLYVARASWEGGLHPGKIRDGFRGVHLSYGGGEHEVASYEVLCRV